MANTNTLTTVIPQILAQGLMALREMAITSRLVNRKYEKDAAGKGSTIDIPIPSAIAVNNVSPSYVAPDDAGVQPTEVTITLDQWKEAPFFMSDKDFIEAESGVLPMQASEAVKAVANTVDNAVLAQYVNFYGYAGVAGTTPFATDASEMLAARKALFDQLAPASPRYVLLDTDAEANALNLRAFQDNSWRGDQAGILEGQIGRKLGSDWFVNQNIPTHTAGTASGATTDTTGYAVGLKTVTLASAGTGTILVGDVITFAGDTQTYTVTSGDADVSGGGTVSFEPGLKVAIETSAHTITVKASHVVNLNFHRDAIALVSRPFAAADPVGLGYFRSAVDSVSGLALRLEASRQHKRTRFAYDILYGIQTVRPEFGARIAG
jgi:hypothetical protein